MRRITQKQFIKASIFTGLLFGLTFGANARSFTFNGITSECAEVSDMTNTLTITGIKVTGVHSWNNGFDYTIIFSNKNEFTGTAAGHFYTYEVAFHTTNPDVIGQGTASFNAGVIPMTNTTTNNLEVTYNTYDGDDLPGMVLGTTYTDPIIINKLNYATATLIIGSQCFNADVTTSGVTLPVKLARFHVVKNGQQILLNWTTLSEQHNNGFEIQRSKDGKEWINVGYANSKAEAGNSAEAIHYAFADLAPIQGVNFYRLKQVDLDNRFTYSEVRKVNFYRNSSIAIYPNPAHTLVNLTGIEATDVLTLTNITGQHIKTIQAGKEAITLNMSELANGIYFISVSKANGAVESFQFVKENR